MPSSGSCDVFFRATFGIEPGAELGRQLAELATHVSIPRGDVAPTDHSEPTLVFLADGATKLGACASQERQQIVAFHFGGDIFSVPADGLHRYILTALRDCSAILFPAREFYDRAAATPGIMRSLLERSQIALHRCRDKAVSLGRKSARERLSGFLLSMAERMDSVDEDRCVLDLPMSRRDIGESLGLTIETVSRQISDLREAGLIETSGRSCITLTDPAALADHAGHFRGERTRILQI